MKKKLVLIGLAAMMILSAASMARASEGKSKSLDCSNATSMVEMKICAGAAYERANEALEIVYKDLLKSLDAEEDRDYGTEAKLRLIASQTAWLDFRLKNAELSGIQYMGGSLESLEQTSKATEMTVARTKELNLLFK